ESRPDGSLGVLLVRPGIAEIGQYPVAPELREEAVVGQDDTSTGGVIGIGYGAHVLRIEPGRQGSRAHQIADHHGEVAALGSRHARLPAWRILADCARGARTVRFGERRPDGLDEPLPVAQGYPELLEIVLRQ